MLTKRECRAVSKLLWDYNENHLGDSDVDRVELHVARCSNCRRDLEAYRITANLVNGYKRLPEPESKATWHALRTQLEHAKTRSPSGSSRPSRRGPVLPVCTGMLAAGAIVAALYSSNQPADNRIDPSWIKSNTGGPPLSPDRSMPSISMQRINPLAPESITAARPQETGPRIQEAGGPIEMLRFRGREEAPSENPSKDVQAGTRADRQTFHQKGSASEPETAKIAKRPEKNFVMPQVGLSGASELTREFVMGSIPPASPQISTASLGGGENDEAPVW